MKKILLGLALYCLLQGNAQAQQMSLTTQTGSAKVDAIGRFLSADGRTIYTLVYDLEGGMRAMRKGSLSAQYTITALDAETLAPKATYQSPGAEPLSPEFGATILHVNGRLFYVFTAMQNDQPVCQWMQLNPTTLAPMGRKNIMPFERNGKMDVMDMMGHLRRKTFATSVAQDGKSFAAAVLTPGNVVHAAAMDGEGNVVSQFTASPGENKRLIEDLPVYDAKYKRLIMALDVKQMTLNSVLADAGGQLHVSLTTPVEKGTRLQPLLIHGKPGETPVLQALTANAAGAYPGSLKLMTATDGTVVAYGDYSLESPDFRNGVYLLKKSSNGFDVANAQLLPYAKLEQEVGKSSYTTKGKTGWQLAPVDWTGIALPGGGFGLAGPSSEILFSIYANPTQRSIMESMSATMYSGPVAVAVVDASGKGATTVINRDQYTTPASGVAVMPTGNGVQVLFTDAEANVGNANPTKVKRESNYADLVYVTTTLSPDGLSKPSTLLSKPLSERALLDFASLRQVENGKYRALNIVPNYRMGNGNMALSQNKVVGYSAISAH